MNAIRYIRKTVFQMRQAEFASVVGVAQSTVSRWEKGGAPSLEEMKAIRDAAAARNIEWSDGWFFEAPPIADDEDDEADAPPEPSHSTGARTSRRASAVTTGTI